MNVDIKWNLVWDPIHMFIAKQAISAESTKYRMKDHYKDRHNMFLVAN